MDFTFTQLHLIALNSIYKWISFVFFLIHFKILNSLKYLIILKILHMKKMHKMYFHILGFIQIHVYSNLKEKN